MRVVDLFCGCGGLSLGLSLAGHEVVCGYDAWQPALETYRANLAHEAWEWDLCDVDSTVAHAGQYAPDMIVGGPPCQDFSSAGKRNEENGRGDLTVRFAEIVCGLRPAWFMMENVPRIARSHKLAEAVELLRTAGYGLTESVLDASLCGVPQRRKRFILVGLLGASDGFLLSELYREQSDRPLTVSQYMGDQLEITHYYRHPRSYARRAIFSVDEPSPTIRGVNRPIPASYRLHAGDGVSTLEGIRPLTTQERSQIQTFPLGYRFVGSRSDIEQMVGNAVPVNLARHVGRAIARYQQERPQGTVDGEKRHSSA